MYFKIVFNGTQNGGSTNLNYQSYRRYGLEALYYILAGTYTSPNNLNSTIFNRSASIITGSAPTSGIYHFSGASNNVGSGATNDDYYLQFFKRHHGYLSDNTNANMQRMIHIRCNNTYSHTVRLCSHGTASVTGGSNIFPNAWNGFLDGSSSADPSISYVTPYYYDSYEGIINDKVFVLKINMIGENYPSLFFAAVDQEFHSTYDKAQRATHQYHCPTVGIWHADTYLETNNQSGMTGTGPRKGNLFGKVQSFGNKYPNGNNSHDSYTSHYHMGYYTSSNVYSRFNSVYPPPWHEILGTTPISNGNKGFIMQPLLYQINYGQVMTYPTYNYSHMDYKESARLMGIWRTGDQTFYTGERVTDAEGNAYRAFRVYKVGASDTSSAAYTVGWNYANPNTKSAVYLFPEGGQ